MSTKPRNRSSGVFHGSFQFVSGDERGFKMRAAGVAHLLFGSAAGLAMPEGVSLP